MADDVSFDFAACMAFGSPEEKMNWKPLKIMKKSKIIPEAVRIKGISLEINDPKLSDVILKPATDLVSFHKESNCTWFLILC